MDEELFVVDTVGEKRTGSLTREEEELTKALFGSLPLAAAAADEEDLQTLVREGETEARKRDRVSEAAWHDSDDELELVEFAKLGTRKMRRKKDEEQISAFEYEQRLREHFEKTSAAPDWAKVPPTQDEAGLFATTASLTSAPSALARDVLQIRRLSALNAESRSDCVVGNVKFCPTAPIALTAGRDKTLRLFQVGEKKCRKLHSVFFVDLPILWAHFVPQCNEVLCVGARKLFYVYDLESESFSRVPHLLGQLEKGWKGVVPVPDGSCSAFLGGESGNVVLYSHKTQQVAHVVKMSGPVDKCSFSPDSRFMWTTGPESDVFKWDLRMTRRCVHRFRDQGIGVEALSNSPDGRWQAIGDKSGMVNIYDLGDAEEAKLHKTVENLVTAATSLCWSHDSQLLCVASDKKADAMKVVHVPSFQTFKNWPSHSGKSAKLGFVADASFSPHSGFLAAGSNTGDAHLFRMLSYSEY